MDARERFRALKDLKLRDEDASDKPLRVKSDEPGSVIKQRERDQATEIASDLDDQQTKLYASRNQKLLIILQGTDTSGKDGTIKALFAGMNPMGLNAVGFKAPTEEEKNHDYLWRVHRHAPGNGEIAVWNRSHYEEVLITRVLGMIDEEECQRRYAQIRDFERMLAENGTTIMKVFLHISKEEQRERLQARLDDPDKHWKFDPADLEQRKHWDAYQKAYEDAINATNTDAAPWYIVPADSKTHRNLIIATLLRDVFRGMDLQFPKTDPKIGKLKLE